MTKRNAIRLLLNSQRFWIPGSAARPRNDAEYVNMIEKIENRSTRNGSITKKFSIPPSTSS